MSFPPGTEMFQFPGFASYTYVFSARSSYEGVAPFGHPWIKACSRLPMAFRSVPRPSSPPGAKASTECPFVVQFPFSPQTGMIEQTRSVTHHAQEPFIRLLVPNPQHRPPLGTAINLDSTQEDKTQ